MYYFIKRSLFENMYKTIPLHVYSPRYLLSIYQKGSNSTPLSKIRPYMYTLLNQFNTLCVVNVGYRHKVSMQFACDNKSIIKCFLEDINDIVNIQSKC